MQAYLNFSGCLTKNITFCQKVCPLQSLTHVCHIDKMGLYDHPWRPVISQSNLRNSVQIHKLCEDHFDMIRKLCGQNFIDQ